MGSDPKLERCPVCAKATYPTWSQAKNDAKAMNRQKRHQGHKAPYRGKCGNIHIGEQSMPRLLRLKRAIRHGMKAKP